MYYINCFMLILSFILNSQRMLKISSLTFCIRNPTDPELVLCVLRLLHPTLCKPTDYSPSGPSVHRVFQARMLEWVAISSSRGFSQPRNQTCISCIGGQSLYHCTSWGALIQELRWMLRKHTCATLDLWKILKEMGIPDHLTCLFRNLYAGQEATVRTGHGTTDWFQIGKRVCQGCILSPCLFKLYTEYIMKNAGLNEDKLESRFPGEISITSDM